MAPGRLRSLATGDGPNLATASVSLLRMRVMICEIKRAARRVMSRVFEDGLARKGWQERTLKPSFEEGQLRSGGDGEDETLASASRTACAGKRSR